jgi:hypothetical protein
MEHPPAFNGLIAPPDKPFQALRKLLLYLKQLAIMVL